MLENIGYVVIPLLFIDIFYMLYTLGCKLMLKRYKVTEKNLIAQGLEVKELTLDDVKDIKVLIGYVISTIIGIVSCFTMNLGDSFLANIKSEILTIMACFLIFYSFYTLIKRIIYGVNYARGFINNFKDDSDDSEE